MRRGETCRSLRGVGWGKMPMKLEEEGEREGEGEEEEKGDGNDVAETTAVPEPDVRAEAGAAPRLSLLPSRGSCLSTPSMRVQT